MVDRVITERIKAEILGNGMDLVGFAPTERWETAPFLLTPQAILPDSKTVIVTGIHITDTWTEMGGEPNPHYMGPGGWMDQNSLLDRIAYRVIRLLNDYGYKAIGVASSNIWRYREFEDVKSLFAPDLSHMHAATAAGLAQLGWTGLAITPEFGPRVRFISIVTDAKLVATPMYDGPNLCDLCMDCVSACPSAAMRKDFNGKPHDITIGGKRFRYANKNIWRCAWAEHFDLDLSSKTLEIEHIDEPTIINEIAEKGLSGHERGVCQKVCIPPHLRTEEGSFGREKQIAMKRVNLKYSDNMPTYKKLRDDIIARAVQLGVDIVGVKKLDPKSSATKYVLAQASGMERVIAFAFRIPSEAKLRSQFNSYAGGAYGYAIRQKMHHILLKIARMIEDFGYHAASYCGSVPLVEENLQDKIGKAKFFEGDYVFKGGFGDENIPLISYQLAEMAGIGSINTQFETPEFGMDVIVGAIATDAPLDELDFSDELGTSAFIKSYSPQKLKEKISALAENNLVSLFGVASSSTFIKTVEDLKKYFDEKTLGKGVVDGHSGKQGEWQSVICDEDCSIKSPNDYLQNAKSVIVLGMHFPGELIENSGLDKTKQIGTYAYYAYQTIYELQFAALELATYLNQLGYKTLITENLLGIGSKVDTPRGLQSDVRCGAIEAVAAGLGEIGKNGSLLTEEYGAHQRQITIITDAELPTDEMYKGEKICTECGNCEKKCTTKALTGKTFKVSVGENSIDYPYIMRNRCDWAKRYSLHKDEGPKLIGNQTHVEISHEGEVTIEEIAEACKQKDQIMKKRTVILEPCLKFCTAGKKS